jgi:hypothetical protein
MRRLSRRTLLRATGAAAGLSLAGSGAARASSDPDDGDDRPRPGPDLLYGENPTPTELRNGPGWSADPLLVSGADAHVDGEYLYQDYVYDDHGAGTTSLPGAPPQPEPADLGAVFSPPSGDYVYPTDAARYAHNAANLLEFRARPEGDEVVYRVTLNTMVEPDLAAVAIGIDTTGSGDADGGHDWGHGLGDLGAPVDPLEATSSANRLSVRLAGVESATLYVGAAGLSLDGLTLDVDADGDATLRLVEDGDERSVSVGAGTVERTL